MRGTGSHYSGCLLTSPGPVLCILFEQVLITPAGNSSKNRTQQWLALHRFLRSSQRGVSGRLCTCPLPAPFSKMAQPQSLGGQGSCLSVTILSHTQHRPGDYGSFLPPFTQKFEWPWHCMSFSDPDLSWGRVGMGVDITPKKLGYELPSLSSSTSPARQCRLVEGSKANLYQDMTESQRNPFSTLSTSFCLGIIENLLVTPAAECSIMLWPDTHQML